MEIKKNSAQNILGALLILSLGLFIGRYVIPAGNIYDEELRYVSVENGERQLVFETFWEAWDALHGNYIGDLEDQDLFYGAVAGMVRAAGDPYTVFSEPVDTKQFEENIGGSFSGVGVEIGMRNGLVTVISPIADSPADKAGVRPEDVIVAVDETDVTAEMSLDEVVSLIRGKKGEAVVLTLFRAETREPLEISIVRDTIEIESVKLEIEDDIAHISITKFNGDTKARFEAVSRQVVNANVKGILLDMRGNPGGLLQSSIDIASYFMPPGTVVLSEKGKNDKTYETSGNAPLQGIPVVVLVDQGSASASEILAGALLDQRGVQIVGMQTFGKGSVQEFIKLKDGSSVRVTVAKWFTPSGRSIDDEGISPTVEVEQDFETEEDEQLLKAKELLQ